MLAAVDHHRAVDDHRPDARRILVRVVVGRAIDDRCGVEQDHVGRLADGNSIGARVARGAIGPEDRNTGQRDSVIAIAANDDQRAPKDKDVLKDTFAAAKLPAEIEVYEGAAHGWCPPDSGVYSEPQAEKAWGRLLALYGKALA